MLVKSFSRKSSRTTGQGSEDSTRAVTQSLCQSFHSCWPFSSLLLSPSVPFFCSGVQATGTVQAAHCSLVCKLCRFFWCKKSRPFRFPVRFASSAPNLAHRQEFSRGLGHFQTFGSGHSWYRTLWSSQSLLWWFASCADLAGSKVCSRHWLKSSEYLSQAGR